MVQLYADGFKDLPLNEKRLVYHLTQAAIAGRDIYWDQRYAHGLAMRGVMEQIVTHGAGIDPATLDRDHALHQTPVAQLRAVQQPHGPQVRAHLHARGVCRRGRRRRRRTAPPSRPTPGESLDQMLTPHASALLRRHRRSDGHAEDARRREGHPAGERQQPLPRRVDGGSQGLHRTLRPQLAPRESRTARLVEEVYKVGGRYDAQIRAIIGHLDAAQAFATPTMKEALAKLAQWYRTGEDADRKAYDIAWVNDKASPVDTIQRLHRGVPRRPWREGLVGITRLLREPPEDRGHREAGVERAVVRGPHAVGAGSSARPA